MYIFKLLVHVQWKWMDRKMKTNWAFLSHPATGRCNLKYNRLILTDNFGMTDLLSRPIFDQCGILLALILCSNTSRSKPNISCPCKVNRPQYKIGECSKFISPCKPSYGPGRDKTDEQAGLHFVVRKPPKTGFLGSRPMLSTPHHQVEWHQHQLMTFFISTHLHDITIYKRLYPYHVTLWIQVLSIAYPILRRNLTHERIEM